MGQLIEQGVFGREDVQVILFDESEDGDRSVVKVSYFDNKGVLLDWPFGFFEPDY